MQNESSFHGLFSIVKAVAVALAFGLISALCFSFLLGCTSLPRSVIYPVNQAIKGVSVAVGALLCIRGEKGWLKGGAVGLLFTMLSYLAFSAIGGDFSLSWLIALELLVAATVGALSGIIAVNTRR